jgi:hypothetical protein
LPRVARVGAGPYDSGGRRKIYARPAESAGATRVESPHFEEDDGPVRRVMVALVLAAAVAAVFGLRGEFTPTILWRGTAEQIRTAARLAAFADIRACHLRICLADEANVMPAYLADEKEEVRFRILDLPEVSLPHRALSPLKQRAAIYARAYNEEVVPYLVEARPETTVSEDFALSVTWPPRLNCVR